MAFEEARRLREEILSHQPGRPALRLRLRDCTTRRGIPWPRWPCSMRCWPGMVFTRACVQRCLNSVETSGGGMEN